MFPEKIIVELFSIDNTVHWPFRFIPQSTRLKILMFIAHRHTIMAPRDMSDDRLRLALIGLGASIDQRYARPDAHHPNMRPAPLRINSRNDRVKLPIKLHIIVILVNTM